MSKSEKWIGLFRKYGWIKEGILVAPPNYRIIIKFINWEGKHVIVDNHPELGMAEVSDDFIIRIVRGAAGEWRHYFAWDDVVEVEVIPK